MRRITSQDIQERVNTINEYVGETMIEVTYRYNYYGIDELSSNGLPIGSPLFTGNAREVFEYLGAMLHGLNQIDRKKYRNNNPFA